MPHGWCVYTFYHPKSDCNRHLHLLILQYTLDVPLIPIKLTDIKELDVESAALIASTLSQAGVPAALWGLNAANLYGGNLVPSVSRLFLFFVP